MKSNNPREIFENWFKLRNWTAFEFQNRLLQFYLDGYSGLLNAPTGSGKTFALWIPILVKHKISTSSTLKTGLKILWITPIRALVKDVQLAMKQSASELGIDWNIATRTGDTEASERAKLKLNPPDCLITTPESLHILLSQKDYKKIFANIDTIVIDEWHELLGTKRGVQIELALSRIKTLAPAIQIWGISATIGNLEQALEVLLGLNPPALHTIVKALIDKKIKINAVYPPKTEEYSWGGHLGIKLIEPVLQIIDKSKSTLVFTNTRAQAEIWYQAILEKKPDWAGLIALHHGSLSKDTRIWVEEALHQNILKAVICTSSLDLGVDFRPVDTVIQIGSPKGVARFVQRAGRSGHQPGAESIIYFVPTHSLELIEAAALRHAIAHQNIEARIPLVRSFDVLIQYLLTLAVAEGFDQKIIFQEIKNTYAFQSIEIDEWRQVLKFITHGGDTLAQYQEFQKAKEIDGIFRILNKRIATLHRLSIGTIVSDPVVLIKYLNGTLIGTVEEYFVSKLKEGDIFTFAGKTLEVVTIRYTELLVRKSSAKSSNIPSWAGGRMPLSSQLSHFIRLKLEQAHDSQFLDPELQQLKPLFQLQNQLSYLPTQDQLLVEYLETRQGFHLFVYTFEGRFVNEGIASLLAYRISQTIEPYSFSIAMNDYGFELLTDKPLPINEIFEQDIFTQEQLLPHILAGLNSTEMARRKFRDIAHIAGLIFTGYPGKTIKNKHLQASSRNFFDVFSTYEPNNLLLKQAYEEVLFDQLDETRLRAALTRLQSQSIIIKTLEKPSPFCFPIMVERIRSKSINEPIEDIIQRLIKNS